MLLFQIDEWNVKSIIIGLIFYFVIKGTFALKYRWCVYVCVCVTLTRNVIEIKANKMTIIWCYILKVDCLRIGIDNKC